MFYLTGNKLGLTLSRALQQYVYRRPLHTADSKTLFGGSSISVIIRIETTIPTVTPTKVVGPGKLQILSHELEREGYGTTYGMKVFTSWESLRMSAVAASHGQLLRLNFTTAMAT